MPASLTGPERADICSASGKDILQADNAYTTAEVKLAAEAVIDYMNLASTRTAISDDINTAISPTVMTNTAKKKIAREAIRLWLEGE